MPSGIGMALGGPHFFGWGSRQFVLFLRLPGFGSAMSGFDLPAPESQGIQELKSRSSHRQRLSAFQLGDIYFQQGSWPKPKNAIGRPWRGIIKTLISGRIWASAAPARQGGEARRCSNPFTGRIPSRLRAYHMAFARLWSFGRKRPALSIWRWVVENHSYPRPKCNTPSCASSATNPAWRVNN